MKILIIGWYGTETIGDRAILAGILSFLQKAFSSFKVTLGSLYPFYSERTVNEDYPFWEIFIGHDLEFDLIDSKNSRQLTKSISNADLVVMGGGPLMHIDDIYMIEYAFKKAKKLGKKTALIGCGVGPVFTSKHKKVILNIIKFSDLIIFRDNQSFLNVKKIAEDLQHEIDLKNSYISFDPAIECCLTFKKQFPLNKTEDSGIVVNLREFPQNYSGESIGREINNYIRYLLKDLLENFKDDMVLVPMHYFYIGNDDRIFLNKLKMDLNDTKLIVQNSPLTLIKTLKLFENAKLALAMRFHAVVLQTILNGNNYIFDYTEPEVGKISGFIKDIDTKGFYNSSRYISLQSSFRSKTKFNFHTAEAKFTCPYETVKDNLTIYDKSLMALL